MQEPGLTTTESRKNPYSLIVALQTGNADGGLYLDDGVSYNTSKLVDCLCFDSSGLYFFFFLFIFFLNFFIFFLFFIFLN